MPRSKQSNSGTKKITKISHDQRRQSWGICLSQKTLAEWEVSSQEAEARNLLAPGFWILSSSAIEFFRLRLVDARGDCNTTGEHLWQRLVVVELQLLVDGSPSQYENLAIPAFSGFLCTTMALLQAQLIHQAKERHGTSGR